MPRQFRLPANERMLPTAAQLVEVPAGLADGSLVSVQEALPFVKAEYLKPDMRPYVGEMILIQADVVPLIAEAYELMQLQRPGFNFLIRYGYRHPDVQERYYNNRYNAHLQERRDLSAGELCELTHTQVAYPPVAGHPTGGAVDLTLLDETGAELDMGTPIADYSQPEKCYTFCETVTVRQWKNRRLLRKFMLDVGFAPFNGEWWHFSYGDREWAYFYSQPQALFAPVKFSA